MATEAGTQPGTFLDRMKDIDESSRNLLHTSVERDEEFAVTVARARTMPSRVTKVSFVMSSLIIPGLIVVACLGFLIGIALFQLDLYPVTLLSSPELSPYLFNIEDKAASNSTEFL